MKRHINLWLFLSIHTIYLKSSICALNKEVLEDQYYPDHSFDRQGISNRARALGHHRHLDRHDPPLPVIILAPSPPRLSTRPTYRRKKPSLKPTYRRKKKTNHPTRHIRNSVTRIPSTRNWTKPSTQPRTQIPLPKDSTLPSSVTIYSRPTRNNSASLTTEPSLKLTRKPSILWIAYPSTKPISDSTAQPWTRSKSPSIFLSTQPKSSPTVGPVYYPTSRPNSLKADSSTIPSPSPTSDTNISITKPTTEPENKLYVHTIKPSSHLIIEHSSYPTNQPSIFSTIKPSLYPTNKPSSYETSSNPSSRQISNQTVNPTNQMSNTKSKSSIEPTSAPSAPPASKFSRKPTIYLTDYPVSMPSGMMNSSCTASPTGSYGVLSEFSISLSIDYKYELVVNKTLQDKFQYTTTNITNDIEVAITNLLAKVFFSDCVVASVHRRHRIRHAQTGSLVSGISSSPPDLISLESCSSWDIMVETQCFVVNGRLSLFLSFSLNTSSALMLTTLNAIAGAMVSDDLTSSNDAIVSLRYIDPASKVLASIPSVSSGTNGIEQRKEWPIIIGAFLGAGVVLIIVAALSRFKKKTAYKREDFINNDPSIADLDDEEMCIFSAPMVLPKDSKSLAECSSDSGKNHQWIIEGNSRNYTHYAETGESIDPVKFVRILEERHDCLIEGRGLFSVAEEQSIISPCCNKDHNHTGEMINHGECLGNAAGKLTEQAKCYSIEGRDLLSVAEELSTFISNNYVDTMYGAASDSDVFDHLPEGVESDDADNSSLNTIRISNIESREDSTSSSCNDVSDSSFTGGERFKIVTRAINVNETVQSDDRYSINGKNLFGVGMELSHLTNNYTIDSIDSSTTTSTSSDEDSDSLPVLAEKIANMGLTITDIALEEYKTIYPENGFSIEGRSLLSLAEELSSVITDNYITAPASECSSSDTLENLSNEDEADENLRPNANVIIQLHNSSLDDRGTIDKPLFDSLKNDETICIICRKTLDVKSRKLCQCGRIDCNLMAHLLCALDKFPLPSVSHPGTPPKSKLLLCRDKFSPTLLPK